MQVSLWCLDRDKRVCNSILKEDQVVGIVEGGSDVSKSRMIAAHKGVRHVVIVRNSVAASVLSPPASYALNQHSIFTTSSRCKTVVPIRLGGRTILDKLVAKPSTPEGAQTVDIPDVAEAANPFAFVKLMSERPMCCQWSGPCFERRLKHFQKA